MLFLILLLTTLLTRLWLFWKPVTSPKVGKIKLHHYMYGLALVCTSFLFSNNILCVIGLGLFIDELPLLLRYGNNFHWKEYNSNYSRFGAAVCIIVIYILGKYLNIF